jgi:hypothetical protein
MRKVASASGLGLIAIDALGIGAEELDYGEPVADLRTVFLFGISPLTDWSRTSRP